jgi:hypothetical protein
MAFANRVMHPVKEIGEYADDYMFLRAFLAECGEANWRPQHISRRRVARNRIWPVLTICLARFGISPQGYEPSWSAIVAEGCSEAETGTNLVPRRR